MEKHFQCLAIWESQIEKQTQNREFTQEIKWESDWFK